MAPPAPMVATVAVSSSPVRPQSRQAWRVRRRPHQPAQDEQERFLLKRSSPALLVEAVRAAVAGDALISPPVTVRLLRALTTPAPSRGPVPALTDRETDIVRVLALGRTNAEIAAELFIASGTVKNHVAVIQRKLGVRNLVGIAAWWFRTCGLWVRAVGGDLPGVSGVGAGWVCASAPVRASPTSQHETPPT